MRREWKCLLASGQRPWQQEARTINKTVVTTPRPWTTLPRLPGVWTAGVRAPGPIHEAPQVLQEH